MKWPSHLWTQLRRQQPVIVKMRGFADNVKIRKNFGSEKIQGSKTNHMTLTTKRSTTKKIVPARDICELKVNQLSH